MVLLATALLAATSAWAQDDDPRFCPNRPSLGSSACTTDPGRVQAEFGALDWQRDDTSDTRDDQVLAGDLLARIGVGSSTELLVAWTAYGHVRERDKASGSIDATGGVGDVTLGFRQNLHNPDGKGLSVAIQPFVTLPTGREPIGAGDYELGVMLPVTYDLSDSLNVAFTGEVDDAADESRDGHHVGYSGILGLSYKLSEQVTAVGELSLAREDDPDDRRTIALVAGSLAWQPRQGLQLDVLTVAGLNRDSPDVRLALGGAVLF
jgi:hypothetical protein